MTAKKLNGDKTKFNPNHPLFKGTFDEFKKFFDKNYTGDAKEAWNRTKKG